MKKIKIFCANEQAETLHEARVDLNGEFVFTCDCGDFIKFPAGLTKDQLLELIEKHKEANEGQVSIKEQEKTLDELIPDKKEEKPEA